ncbi:ORF-120 [Catopsilia pomona nucleopolyhedrovirus]|uniref:ORF-120 n=1 Tax=Catopsilia pomona nucleopolyhedrovirus TaxID=1850906 RepID=A0A172WZJ0_9ABAC|nr:ORF-120 [Catopsilia pomona nucleopolyhedrovirus]ANF29768.1 ORF-120 [Catopsilia pomona nucleopolyhedrovirus]
MPPCSVCAFAWCSRVCCCWGAKFIVSYIIAMDYLLNQIKLGVLPYITTKHVEERLRDRILTNVGANFHKDCFENVVVNSNGGDGVFVLAGGAAVACHINDGADDNNALKCVDLEYYNFHNGDYDDDDGDADYTFDNINNGLNVDCIQKNLQNCVDRYYNALNALAANVRMNDTVVFKCFQNGAYQLCEPIVLHVRQQIKCMPTVHCKNFNLVRFALQIEAKSDYIVEYCNDKILQSNTPLCLNAPFVNVLIMKRCVFNGDRCTRPLLAFGDKYRVLLPSLQRVLNGQLMCLLKDIFTNRFEYKIKRREKRICKLFEQLPNNQYGVQCVNDQQLRHRNGNNNGADKYNFVCNTTAAGAATPLEITNFVKKILDVNGPILGCRTLINLYLTTNTFNRALPPYVMYEINYPHGNDCAQNWKRFMSCIYSFINNKHVQQ